MFCSFYTGWRFTSVTIQGQGKSRGKGDKRKLVGKCECFQVTLVCHSLSKHVPFVCFCMVRLCESLLRPHTNTIAGMSPIALLVCFFPLFYSKVERTETGVSKAPAFMRLWKHSFSLVDSLTTIFKWMPLMLSCRKVFFISNNAERLTAGLSVGKIKHQFHRVKTRRLQTGVRHHSAILSENVQLQQEGSHFWERRDQKATVIKTKKQEVVSHHHQEENVCLGPNQKRFQLVKQYEYV